MGDRTYTKSDSSRFVLVGAIPPWLPLYLAVRGSAQGHDRYPFILFQAQLQAQQIWYYLASIQLGPEWTSTSRGTANSTAWAIVALIRSANTGHSSGGISKTSSSWTCSSSLAW